MVLPDGCHRLKSLPVGIVGADSSRSQLGFRLAQLEELGVAVGEVEPVTAFMARGRETRDRLAVVHRHQEPRVVDAAFMLISDYPECSRSRGGEFAVAEEGAEAVGAGVGFHVDRKSTTSEL